LVSDAFFMSQKKHRSFLFQVFLSSPRADISRGIEERGRAVWQRTFDHSFADGVSQELHFELPQYGPATKPFDWTSKDWHYTHHQSTTLWQKG
jgi:hypothetical protein